MYRKFQLSICYSKRDIDVQKIKVENISYKLIPLTARGQAHFKGSTANKPTIMQYLETSKPIYFEFSFYRVLTPSDPFLLLVFSKFHIFQNLQLY